MSTETIATLTQERDAMRVVLTSEIDARIKAESRALAADGLRVQLADARDRLDLCAAAVERLTQERDLAQERIVELLREAQWHRQEWQKMHDQMQEQRVRAEKAETVRDEARDCLGRTVDQRVEAEADRDAAKTRIAAALRCLEGKHYPAAIQALTIGADGCALPPDPAMLKRLEEVTGERDHLRKEWDTHKAQIRKQERGYAETVASLTAERDAAREQHKALTAALGLAERARDGWRGRCLTSEEFGRRQLVRSRHGRPCPGCKACQRGNCLIPPSIHHSPGMCVNEERWPREEDLCGGSEWVATASPEPARNAPQPDLTLEAVAHGGTEPAKGAWAPTSSQRDDLDTLDEGRPDPKGTEKAGHVGWLLHAHDATWQAKHQGPPAGCKGCAEQIEIPLTEMRRERDEWKARAKEAEDRAGYCARGRNKASADADKAQRERDEARAEVAILRAGDERPADLIIKTRQGLDAALAEWRDKAIKAAPYAELVRDLAASANHMAFGPLKARARALTGDATAPAEQPVQEAGRFRVRADRSTGELRLQAETGGSWLNPELRRAGFQHGDVVALVKVGDLAPLGTAPATPDLPRAIRLLVSRPAPTHETIQRLCKWIGGIPLGETHRVLMDLCKAGRLINRGLPDGYRLADEAAVHVAPLGTTPSGYDIPAPVAPEQVKRIETAPSWKRAREAWLTVDAMVAYGGDVSNALRLVEACVYRGECGWADPAKDAHAAIDELEKATKDSRLWTVGQKFAHNRPDQLTPLALAIIALREATPRPEPIPTDVPTGQEDQHDADMRATEPTTKETP